ncbi:MAG: aminotransferase class I/II-fold pyridoxal phosphate-dependent enzyme [Candidatus Gastranaerophilales bacterium]|nr:aminotransferase class I/II-fold pyridoxal phosphate-dependent enzyme [Candidatus Gastranaerophilales bacterium]
MKFEDFVYTKENDLFYKVKLANEYLDSGETTGTEGLGVQILEKSSPELIMREKNGHEYSTIMLGSNSYLNLTQHPQVIEGARKALEKYGYGMGAVSLYAGITDLHRELEERIANFYGTEDAIVFPSGYGANVGIISALCNENDVIINDSENHASIFDGCKLSGAKIKVYPHSNTKQLEKILSRLDDSVSGRLIITDGVFSMSGDLAKLDKIVELAQKYGAKLMVDDAHGLGIIGKTGRGTAQHFDVMNKVDLHVGMLSKVPGAIGGYCATTKEIARYLRLYARTYFFSTAIPAPIIGGLIEVFKLLEHDIAGRVELWGNINYMKSQLEVRGFNVSNSQSGIIPIIVGDEKKLFEFYNDLRLSGVYTNIVTYPAVRRKECRLRLCVMKELTKDQMDRAIEIITQKGKEYGIIE